MRSAVIESGEAKPFQDARLVAVQVQDNGRRRAVEEVESSLPSTAAQAESTHSMAGQPGHPLLATGEGNKNHVDQSLLATGQALSQAEQTLPLLAEGIEANAQVVAVGPENFVPLEGNLVVLAVAVWGSLQENP